jgi:hypothetical protein
MSVPSFAHLAAIDVAECAGLRREADDALHVLEDAVLAGDVCAHQLDVLRDVRLGRPDLCHPHLNASFKCQVTV